MLSRGATEAWIVEAVRTPIGRQGGALSSVRPDDLGALTLEALMEKTGVPHSEIEDVYMGCTNQAGEDNRNVASDKASPWSPKGTPGLQRLVSFSTRTGYTRVRRKLLKDKVIGYVKGNRLT